MGFVDKARDEVYQTGRELIRWLWPWHWQPDVKVLAPKRLRERVREKMATR